MAPTSVYMRCEVFETIIYDKKIYNIGLKNCSYSIKNYHIAV